MSNWPEELFPRRTELGRMAKRILDALDELGYLKAWGWRRTVDCSGFPRSAVSSAMSALIRHGYVESRDAEIRGPTRSARGLAKVYVRSERFLHSLAERNQELADYRRRHPWWLPAGPLRIPAGDARHSQIPPRRLGPLQATVSPNRPGLTRPTSSSKEDLADLEPSNFDNAYSLGERPKDGHVFKELGSLLRMSEGEASMFAHELAAAFAKAMRQEITAEDAAQYYLRFRNWDFRNWCRRR